MILQLNPTIPVIVTSKDNAKGYAILVTDYSQEHHLYWTVALDNGEIWTVPNTEIRLQDNWTMGRREGVQAILCPFCLKPCGKSCRQWIDAENKAAREKPLVIVGSPEEDFQLEKEDKLISTHSCWGYPCDTCNKSIEPNVYFYTFTQSGGNYCRQECATKEAINKAAPKPFKPSTEYTRALYEVLGPEGIAELNDKPQVACFVCKQMIFEACAKADLAKSKPRQSLHCRRCDVRIDSYNNCCYGTDGEMYCSQYCMLGAD